MEEFMMDCKVSSRLISFLLVVLKLKKCRVGGALYIRDSTHLYVTDTRFEGLLGIYGGAALFDYDVYHVLVEHVWFINCNSTVRAGGLMVCTALKDYVIDHVTFLHNNAGKNHYIFTNLCYDLYSLF